MTTQSSVAALEVPTIEWLPVAVALRRVFDQPRGLTVARLGGLSLLHAMCTAAGAAREAAALAVAVQPLAVALDVNGIHDIPDALSGRRGGPTRGISNAASSEALAAAVRLALAAVDAPDPVRTAGLFSPKGSAGEPTELEVLTGWPSAAQQRDAGELLRMLFRRMRELEKAFELPTAPRRPRLPAIMSRTKGAARAHLALPGVDPKKVTGMVPLQARHPNRVGRLLGAGAVTVLAESRIGGEFPLQVRRGLAMFAAVADAVDSAGHGQRRVTPRSAREVAAWLDVDPMQWWQTIDEWGSSTPGSANSLVWLLRPAEGDAVTFALSWALAMIGATVDAVTTADPFEQQIDGPWTTIARRAWDLVQSQRRPSARGPWPGDGDGSSGNSVLFSELDGAAGSDSYLPWAYPLGVPAAAGADDESE